MMHPADNTVYVNTAYLDMPCTKHYAYCEHARPELRGYELDDEPDLSVDDPGFCLSEMNMPQSLPQGQAERT